MGIKNTLGDLNNHLFAQLERLSDEDIKGEQLEEEMDRARAVTSIAQQIISNGQLILKSKELQIEYCKDEKTMPAILQG
jgi:hypothetical protein